MPLFLDSRDPDFAASFAALLASKREASVEVSDTVAGIIADVRARGDEAVVELTNRFDQSGVTAETLRIPEAEIAAAAERTAPDVRAALQVAHDRIRAHHEKQKPTDHVYQDALGVTLGTLWTPIEAVGIYVPGGTASYPSSVLMNAVPAKVAGVERIAMVVPTPRGEVNPAVLAADVYVTSDLRHHPASEAAQAARLGRGPALVDVSHWASEWLWLEVAAEQLRAELPGVEVGVSELRTDPWEFAIV